MTDAPWWQKPTAILAHFHDINQKPERDPRALDRLVRWKLRAGFDAEHVIVNYTMLAGKGGEDSRAYLFRNFHGFQEDWLGLYLPIARRHGLKVLVYFNCHWFKPDTFPADYYVVDAAGKPKVIYGDGGEVCCRGPFRAWSEKMAEDLGRYPIDGVFLDGPVKDACWCPHCRAAYQARFDAPLPDPKTCPPEQASGWEAFKRDMAVGYIEAFARGLRKHNPDALLYCNGGGSAQMKASLPWTQFVGEEGGFIGYGPLTGEFPFQTGRAARELVARGRGRGRVVFCDCGFKRFDYHVHPRGEIARMYASTLAQGASPWFLVWRDAIRSEGVQTVLRFNRLLREHRDTLADGGSLAETALFRSPLNLELAGSVPAASGDDVHRAEAGAQRLAVPRHTQEFHGLYAALARSGYPFDTIEDDALLEEGGIPERIRLLILPGVSALSDRAAERVRAFVRAGGRVLATFDTGLFDEHGNRRPDFALADVFGVRLCDGLVGPSGLDYLAVTGRHALTAGMSQAILPCPEYRWLVQPKAPAQAPLHFYEPMPRRYSALPGVSKHPAAVLNRYGKGQALFLPSTIGHLSLVYRFPDLRRLLANAANLLARPPVALEGGGGEFVEATLRRGADSAVAIHLINWASGERPSDRAIPLGPVSVSVRLPRGVPKPKSVRLVMAGRKAACSVKAGMLCFQVPRLEEYELAIIPDVNT
jgi:hypothetical protein